jgi:hypothetical protein
MVPPLNKEKTMADAKNKGNGNKAQKTICAIGRDDFRTKAQPLTIDIGGSKVTGEVKEFSTGSFGWYSNGKVTVVIDGKPVTAQVGLNLIVVGSKELPR